MTSKHEAIRDANATTELGADHVISGVRRVYENCALLGCYTASSDFLSTFRDNLTLTLGDSPVVPKRRYEIKTPEEQRSQGPDRSHTQHGLQPGRTGTGATSCVSTLQFGAPNQEHTLLSDPPSPPPTHLESTHLRSGPDVRMTAALPYNP